MEKGDGFVTDLGLVLALPMCPDQSQALNEFNSSQAFTARRKTSDTFHYLGQLLPGAPRHVVHGFAQIY